MRARRKGTNNPYTRVEKIQLQDSDILYNVDVMEFEPHQDEETTLYGQCESPSQDHWQDVRERAAIAALSGLLSAPNTVGSCKQFAETAVDYADALIEELKKK